MRFTSYFDFLLRLIATLAFVSLSLAAQPDIHFNEYRILLTEKNTSQNYRIFNQGDSEASCRVSFIDYLISEKGQLTLAKEAEKLSSSASSMLKASPSKVLIPPLSNQKVKVLVRRLKKKSDQEWVSYLNLQCKDANPELQNGLNLLPNYIFNIPVVVRKGNLSATAQITQAKLISKNNNQIVEFILNRTGQRSLYGDISISDENGSEIGSMIGVSHYQQTTNLPLSIILKRSPKGKTTIKFKERAIFGGELEVNTDLD